MAAPELVDESEIQENQVEDEAPPPSTNFAAPTAAVDVPPPPAQMEAVLAEYEVDASERFHVDVDPTAKQNTASAAASFMGAERVVVHARTGLTVPPPRNWSPLFWSVAAAAGAVVGVFIVYTVVVNRSSTVQEVAVATTTPATSAAGIPEPIPEGRVADTSSATTATTAPADVPTAPPIKPESKTVRSQTPVPSRAAASVHRKPCSKASKPCK